jgi:hypothetical protein
VAESGAIVSEPQSNDEWPTTEEGISIYMTLSVNKIPDRDSCLMDVSGLGDGGSATLLFDRHGNVVFRLTTAAGSQYLIRGPREELGLTLGEPIALAACVGRLKRKLVWRVRLGDWAQWHTVEAESGSRLPSESQFSYVLGNSASGDAGAFASFGEIVAYVGVKSASEESKLFEYLAGERAKFSTARVQFDGEQALVSKHHPNPPTDLKPPIFRNKP